ncbi:mitochondrial carrier domain-containing protein [Boletus edulis]|uniref:Mitochondrial carrier domain-containing protein n=1 Tax=Boletus edulis BED1 TaxID=1328754 RepID=A0AAD4GFA3_BOLED|nr:mitochondrial carrier domain-containing protein [Boletus edulis]KAF8440492.1 mitochondrial carrier domain-containing protein [Boletus edulis BED1]
MSSTVASHRDRRSLDYAFRSGLAGGLAGCVAKTVVAPLDRVKILFQASNPDFQKYAGSWTGTFRAGLAIYRDAGTRGLLQGHSATLLRIFPYAAIKFMAYDQCRPLLIPTRDHETNFRRFTAGALAGMASVTLTYPLELIRVRMAFDSRMTTKTFRPSFIRAISHIYHEAAIFPTLPSTPSSTPKQIFERFPTLKFYRGFTVTMVGMIPYAGTGFLVWDFCRAYFYPVVDGKAQRPGLAADLAIGAVSGAISQTVSYPFEVVRRRMQVGGLTRPDRWLGWGETMKAVYASGGWRGFFVGLSIGYLKVIPMTGISFAAWQVFKRMLGL